VPQSVLEIDVGNTRLKWRVSVDGCVCQRGALVQADFASADLLLAELSRALMGVDLTEVRVACVAAAQVSVAIDGWVRQHFSLVPHFATVSRRCAGVEVGYDEPERLGVDRWLAVLAASRICPAGALVVDCGSAVTVDVLLPGRHAGGYIVPGLQLMVAALFQDTHAVKVTFESIARPFPGRVTADAVNAGLPLMVAGFVNEVSRRLVRGEFDRGARDRVFMGDILLTGGDAAVVAPLLDGSVQVLEELVLDGLKWSDWQVLKDRG